MNLNFYDVMKKIIYFSTIVSLIFLPYSKCVNICYYDEVWFDLLLLMLYKKEKYFWNAIKILCICIGYKLVYIIAEAERKWVPTIKDVMTNKKKDTYNLKKRYII